MLFLLRVDPRLKIARTGWPNLQSTSQENVILCPRAVCYMDTGDLPR